ncbi:MAG: class I SAM-dependent methyltransferase [Phycisphaerales bacterium]|nr:class I SAM-dependent methyltransferase [Phycisphaerales bacterium]
MSSPQVKVTVQCRWNNRQEEADTLAHRLNSSCVDGDRVPPGEYRIILFEHGAELWDEHSRKHGMPIDFHGIDLRTGNGSLSHKQPIAKSIGRSARTIVDATAGLGHDAFLLACLGWDVHAIERHPVIGLLLEESLREARSNTDLSAKMGGRLNVHIGDACEWLLQPGKEKPDVIYLDPMFEPRRRSALPRKPAQVLRNIVGRDDDVMKLFDIAMQTAQKRVVVKRSDDAQPLFENPNQSHHGKIVRYDVYLSKGKQDG